MESLGMEIYRRAVRETRRKNNVQNIINVMEEFSVSLDRTMEVLKIAKSEQSLYRKLVEEKIGQ